MTEGSFFGVEITFDSQRRKSVQYHGGHAPRPMTEDEFQPWLNLAGKCLENQTKKGLDSESDLSENERAELERV